MAGLVALLVLITAAAYQVFTDGYRVETRLLFLKSEQGGDETISWPLAQELEILKSSGLRSYLASSIFHALHGEDRQTVSCGAPSGSVTPEDGLARFSDSHQFEQWLSESLHTVGVVSNGVAKVQLALDGNDPVFLKTVLDQYVRQYVKHRNAWAPHENMSTRLASMEREAVLPSRRLQTIDDRIHEIAMSKREVELALNHLDSGKGIFRGFIPVSVGAGTAYLRRFQDKIVELEIKKRTMAARFTSKSSEMRAIRQEIKGIREAMREALNSQLVFLQRQFSGLQARRAQLAKRLGPVRETGASRGPTKPCSGRFNGRDSWYFANDGLYIITDRPSTVHRPLTAKAEKFTKVLYAYLFPSDSLSTTTAVARAADKTRENIVLTGCVTTKGLYMNHTHTLREGENSEPGGTHVASDPNMAGRIRMVSTSPSETRFGRKKSAPGK